MVGHASLGVLLGIRHIVSPERLLGMLLVLILLLLLLLWVVIAGVLLLLLHVMGVRLLLPGVRSLTRMRVHLLRRLRLARVRSIMRMLTLLGHSAVLVGHSPVGIHSVRMVLHVLWGVAPVRMALLLRVWLVVVLGHMSLAIVASLIVVKVAASSPWTVEIAVRVRTLGRPPAPSLTIGTTSSHVHVGRPHPPITLVPPAHVHVRRRHAAHPPAAGLLGPSIPAHVAMAGVAVGPASHGMAAIVGHPPRHWGRARVGPILLLCHGWMSALVRTHVALLMHLKGVYIFSSLWPHRICLGAGILQFRLAVSNATRR